MRLCGSLHFGRRPKSSTLIEIITTTAFTAAQWPRKVCQSTPLRSTMQDERGLTSMDSKIPHHRRAARLNGSHRLLQDHGATAYTSPFEHAEVRSCWYVYLDFISVVEGKGYLIGMRARLWAGHLEGRGMLVDMEANWWLLQCERRSFSWSRSVGVDGSGDFYSTDRLTKKKKAGGIHL